MTAVDIYNQSIKPLPPAERLRVAALILNDMADQSVEYSDEWTEEDLRDWSNWSWNRIAKELADDEDA